MRGFPFDATEIAILAFLLFVTALFFVAVSCAPHTDLYAEAMTGGGDPAGGSAAGALVDPPAGSSAVPDNLAGVVVRLPVAIAVASASFRLQPSPAGGGAGVGAAPLGTPAAAPCALGVVGSCYRVPIAGALGPNRTYLLELLAGTMTEPGGTPAISGAIGAFDTGDSADDVAPQVTDFAVAIAGPCLGVRFSTDEPVAAEVALRADAGQAITAAGTGQSAFDLAVPFSGLVPGARAQVLLRVTDRAGNRTESIAGEVDVPPETPPLVITEVLANPAGTEPGQEFVELRNVGGGDVPLAGLRLEDSKGGDVLPEASLGPGAYALVVPSSFDPHSTRDVAPRPGTLMIPVDTRLGSDGLSNGGEVVRLRMPGMAMEPIISIYGGWVDVSAASAAGKSAHRLDDDACDHPSAWTRPPRAATPGWGTP